ncbi:MAG: chromosome segregation protein SMC [Oceanospirillaceae bacterium]|nr:chromosome segregation protein SMC [Oceanospirillaceae bacterium]MCP5351233.1 chromosome segregation protein SMC [Oceanospirillaceae bacterium]
MRLKSIKLAGFKSFVDPTKIPFPTNLTCIVGPNGCGKSNTIDAVRWVMGESSAKNLRGDAMTDVIFNGSSARKPVGQASVELVFDNSEGKLKGEYAQYTEISLKRKVTRDGQSAYYINGVKCRRRDITDLFLGTGLGPRSYAIIEQGMISRLIESKPEELRVYIEEAAGISKYKERRKETESRIRRTHENLERLTDIREELDRQLQHLHRQAQAAEKYKAMKVEERQLKAELLATRWLAMDHEMQNGHQKILEQETALEAAIAGQRENDAQIEERRIELLELTDLFEQVQTRYYEVGAEIARFEQSIQYQAQRAGQLAADLKEVDESCQESIQAKEEDAMRLEALDEDLMGLEPEMELLLAEEETLAEQLALAEENMQQWQSRWDAFNQDSAQPQQQAEVAKTRIQSIENNLVRLEQRQEKLRREQDSLGSSSEDEEQLAMLQEQIGEQELMLEARQADVETAQQNIQSAREKEQALNNALNTARSELQSLLGRKASLQALQQAAMGGDDDSGHWIQSQQLQHKPRLAQQLQVESGWEYAVETALQEKLQAVQVDDFTAIAERLAQLKKGTVTLFDKNAAVINPPARSLAHKVSGCALTSAWLGQILCAEDLADALSRRAELQDGQSLMTRDGIWLGKHWMQVQKSSDGQSGVLARQQELETLLAREDDLDAQVDELEADLDAARLRLHTLEQQKDNAQREVAHQNQQVAEARARVQTMEARLQQVLARRAQLNAEQSELRDEQALMQEQLAESRLEWQQALSAMEQDAGARENLLGQRDNLRTELDNARQRSRQQKDHAHQHQLKLQTLNHQKQSLLQAVSRHEQQLQRLQQRREQLLAQQNEGDAPVEEMRAQLEEMLANRLDIEAQMQAARRNKESVETALREFEQGRQKAEQQAAGIRSKLEQMRMDYQTISTRRVSIEEQLAEQEIVLQEIISQLPEQPDLLKLQDDLEQVQQRISRLGAINLAAIDEYKTQSERKTYLDAQNEDLQKALETLEGAIRKIDAETRTRFKETFDKVNNGLKELFPKVFGGGHAYLEFTGEDLLDTGIALMARPPGKKNSTIHLLSGGEKALTAIALVFSIFRLNPAPFCMLDEVDAPLDDANVGRYARLVSAMSDQVQFIYISHNKIAMEMADQLMGVTMHEPGVSRLVSVNMEEAVSLVES